MADNALKWLGIVTAIVLGLGLVLQPTLISMLPKMLHYILGFVLIGMGGYGAYKIA